MERPFFSLDMEIHIYNTYSKHLEPLTALSGKGLNLFVCGPTVYDYSHLGHAKTYTQFDMIVKYLRTRGFDVYYLQNITDIDDKIIRRAEESGIGWRELTDRFEKEYLTDMAALGVSAVTKYARATDYIDEIVSQISRLLDRGYAYEAEDGIYFEIAKFIDYGRLSGRQEIAENDAISRIDSSTSKRGWNDFCLWKKSKPNEPSWNTILGHGRPGWHIEDTAITEKNFGQQYDIHGGAVDLIFPHHEAEIAQMEAASGKKPMVRYWMHTGFLNIDSRKMSKSLSNFRTIRDTIKQHNPRAIRLYFVFSHYRSTLDFSDSTLQNAQSILSKFDEFVFRIDRSFDDKENEKSTADLIMEVDRFMSNDFDTQNVLTALTNFIKKQNAVKNGWRVIDCFKKLDSFLGIFDFSDQTSEEEIACLINERNALRKNGDFAGADAIRDGLMARGIKLYDTEDGTRHRKIS